MLDLTPRRSASVAYVAAGLNLAAALAMWFFLGPGLPTPGSLASGRLAFVRSAVLLWRLGWLLWHAAAIALVLLLLLLARRFAGVAALRTSIASIVALAGLAADLAAEAISM